MAAVVALIDGRPGRTASHSLISPAALRAARASPKRCVAGARPWPSTSRAWGEIGEALPRVRDIAEIRTDRKFAEDSAAAAIVTVVEVDPPGRDKYGYR
jgi:hypothetical protein